MTTVGYGDYMPKTYPGRLIAIINTFWGVFLVSMMVVTLTISSEFEPKEQRAFDILNRLTCREGIKNAAAFVVKQRIKQIIVRKKSIKQ